jgi:hypothetical protein
MVQKRKLNTPSRLSACSATPRPAMMRSGVRGEGNAGLEMEGASTMSDVDPGSAFSRLLST